MKTYIIAEAGINHNRSLTLAKALVDAAKAAGADVVKFQHEKPSEEGPVYCLTNYEIMEVNNYCKKAGIAFACTAFDVESLDFLLKYTEMAFIKIASCDALNADLIRRADWSLLPIIQSLRRDAATLTGNKPRKFLHVVSEYPTPLEKSDLKRLWENGISGLSDHSGNPMIPVLAVGMGAQIVEVHLTLDRRMEGPDHTSSLNSIQFAQMVKNIREAEIAIA